MPTASAGKGPTPPPINIQRNDSDGLKVSNPTRRARSSSLVTVEQVGESLYEVLDQSAYANQNVEWVNYKGGFT